MRTTGFFVLYAKKIRFPKINKFYPIAIDDQFEAGGKAGAGLATFASAATLPKKKLGEDDESLEGSFASDDVLVGITSFPGNKNTIINDGLFASERAGDVLNSGKSTECAIPSAKLVEGR